MSRARTLAGAIGSDGALNVADVAGLAAVASSGSASDLSTGTLPIARIADGAVVNAKLGSDLDASKLTAGTLPNGRLNANTVISSSNSNASVAVRSSTTNGSAVFVADGNSTSSDIGMRLEIANSLKWLAGMPNNIADANYSVFNATTATDALRINASDNALFVNGNMSLPTDKGAYMGQHISYGSGYGITKSVTSVSAGSSSATFRIGYISRHYWGSGPVFLNIYHSYYSGFRRSRYGIDGDSKYNDGGDLSVFTEYDSGYVNAPTIGSYTYFPGDSVNQYAPIFIYVSAYNGYTIEWECTYISVYHQSGIAPGANSIVIHPSPVQV